MLTDALHEFSLYSHRTVSSPEYTLRDETAQKRMEWLASDSWLIVAKSNLGWRYVLVLLLRMLESLVQTKMFHRTEYRRASRSRPLAMFCATS